MRRVLPLIAALALVVGAPGPVSRAADETTPNPPYLRWAGYWIGTTVTLKERVKSPERSSEATDIPGGVRERDLTYRLLQVTPEKAVVRLTVTEYGPGEMVELAPSTITYPAQVRKDHAGASEAGRAPSKEGDEDVTLLGKSVRTHWAESSRKAGDMTVLRKVWTSEDVPGGVVKETETQTRGGQTVSETERVVFGYEK